MNIQRDVQETYRTNKTQWESAPWICNVQCDQRDSIMPLQIDFELEFFLFQ